MNLTQQGRSYLSRKVAIILVLSTIVILPGASIGADVLKPPKVVAIQIYGNDVFSDGQLKRVMKTKERSLLRPFRRSAYRKDFLQADIESILGLYRRHGYLKTKVLSERVEKTTKGNAVVVFLEISEGPRTIVKSVSIEGEAALPERVLSGAIRLKRDVPFDPGLIEEDKASILERYAEAGYIYAEVSDNTVFDGDSADVYYSVNEGIRASAGDISVEGNRTTAERLVRREVTLEPGDILRRSEVLRTQQRIFDTGLYSDVQLSPVARDSAGAVVDLLVRVRERKMAWVGAGIGYGSSDQLRVLGEWGHRNVRGSGLRLFTSASFAFGRWWLNQKKAVLDAARLDVGLVEPWLLGTRTTGQAVAYHEYRREAAFTQEFTGFTLTGKRDLSSFSKVFLSYDNRWVNTTDPTAIRSKYVTRSLVLSVLRDLRDDIFDPARGSYQEATWKVAGGALGGNYSFHKMTFSSSWYSPVGDVTVATRVKVGFEEPFGETYGVRPLERIPFEERFRTGGSMSVRGYVEEDEIGPRDALGNAVGGRFLLLSNVEVRFPLFWRFTGAVFLDGGNVWENPTDLKLENFSMGGQASSDSDYRYSYGGGVRLATPVGPVRVDYGRKLRLSPQDGDDRGQLHLSIGQAF